MMEPEPQPDDGGDAGPLGGEPKPEGPPAADEAESELQLIELRKERIAQVEKEMGEMDQETLEKAELYAEYQSLLMEGEALEGKDKEQEGPPKSFICPITQ